MAWGLIPPKHFMSGLTRISKNFHALLINGVYICCTYVDSDSPDQRLDMKGEERHKSLSRLNEMPDGGERKSRGGNVIVDWSTKKNLY